MWRCIRHELRVEGQMWRLLLCRYYDSEDTSRGHQGMLELAECESAR